ncbi:Disease resistance protein RML1B [Cardamine amara subsp. amara]|uniref:ADP-ribosyl cyclase/cyclic ADP-ribose hydrolase n=1 Tax=Cardamine amara subsp. amara TaxID=228776 RepID=A0ABD1C768_CARAN
MSLMASPSSSLSSRNWSYNVFASFNGPDVRKTLLSHMREQFTRNGITMFNDQKIERSATIAPSLAEGIRESRISIVILSKQYASSSWCLDELVEILKCTELMEQIVMTIFYGVDPSDVRKQTGEFGIAFNETCARKSDEERQKWSKALNEVGNIAGEDFFRWDNEANMIKKIARDISDKLNATPSRDFDGMVGLEAHLREMESLLDLDYDGVKMVGISGPAGIGKSAIARALHSRLSNRFQLTCFVDNLRESYPIGLDEYGLKLRLQEHFLSKVLNQNGLRISHLRVIEERLCKQKVLIILDDVNNIKQLEALANETTWFGPGSRIVVTTENKELLKQHGIKSTYHVGFPSDEQALKILCRYAFRQNSTDPGFEELAKKVTELCNNLPLGLRVVGSSLRKKKKGEWNEVIHMLKTVLDRDIEEVLRVGYESLKEDEQSLFLNIAVFFNNKDGDLVKAMFADNKLDIKQGLKILVNRSLIYISDDGEIVMHKLLQQLGTTVVHREESRKSRILIDAPEICDVLERAEGTRAVSGISFDITGIDELSVSKKAFKRMPNLRFLRVYKSKEDGNDILNIPEKMDFPLRLRLLHWEAYPSKSLPPTFYPEYLVELNFEESKLEKLWEGAQLLTNLKKIDLTASMNLKELPDLSNAINLEILNLICCGSLVEIPSSCLHLHKLNVMMMNCCPRLEVIPADMNLASLERVYMSGCSRLRFIPVMSTNLKQLYLSETAVEDVPASVRLCSSLECLDISRSGNFKALTHLPTSIRELNLSYCDIERIPDFIKDLRRLQSLNLSGCRRLVSLPELPYSLTFLLADDCESLETVFCPLITSNADIKFTNCFKLWQQARKVIIRHSFRNGLVILPGSKVPAEFDHQAIGNFLTIRPDVNRPLTLYSGFVVCLVISPNQQNTEYSSSEVLCHRIAQGDLRSAYVGNVSEFRREHLFIFHSRSLYIDPSEVGREIAFEFSSKFQDFDIMECGVQFLTDEKIYQFDLYQPFEENIQFTQSIMNAIEHDNEFEPNVDSEDDTEYGDYYV